MIRVLIVDDHKILKDGIKAVLRENQLIQVVGDLPDGRNVLSFLEKTPTDVILMDINLPDISGIEATKSVMEHFDGQVKVLALSMYNEETYIRNMLSAGAKGYVLKSSDMEELTTAIHKVYFGDSFYSEEVTKTIMGQFVEGKPKRVLRTNASLGDLTQRETAVLRLIAEEMTNHEIANSLNISSRTVDTHRRNLLQKLGLKNTAGLVKFALQQNLIRA